MAEEQVVGAVTTLVTDVRKADTKAMITNGVEAFPDDSFTGLYWSGADGELSSVAILEPVFKPGTLKAITSQNNVLLQCVEAMEVNVDGTGHSIELVEGASESPAEKDMLSDFFSNPYPGKSMVAIRRAIRRDVESCGSGYLEVIRNASDEIVLINDLPADDMRLIRLDASVSVITTVRRAGKDVSISLRVRERRFVQYLNGVKVYFKEFGASRDLNRNTGVWAEPGVRLPVDVRASEIIYFTGNKEAKTPYGTPRWINQLPSTLGSRKAEEHNLEFFDGGGIPPVLVLVEGGTLGQTVKDDLKRHLNGGRNNRAAVVEAVSTSGTLTSAGTVKVRVERFGAERQQDAMFQGYDKSCEEHVRCAFRLPPLFLGKAQDYSFATAYTAYMVAEAQVFLPERVEFDDRINATIVKALGAKSYKYRSLPLTLVDVQNQLKALELASGAQAISGEEMVSKLNEVSGLSMEFSKQEAPPVEGPQITPGAATSSSPGQPPSPKGLAATPTNGVSIQKGDGLVGLLQLSAALRKALLAQKEDSLLPEERAFISGVLSTQEMNPDQMAGLEELLGCACAVGSGK